MSYQWDPKKAASNLEKHGVDLADAVGVFEDEWALMSEREYDFEQAERGAVVKPLPGKTRITIRIDADVLGWFRRQVHEAGGGSYQTLINEALREYIQYRDEMFENVLRKVIREELQTLVR